MGEDQQRSGMVFGSEVVGENRIWEAVTAPASRSIEWDAGAGTEIARLGAWILLLARDSETVSG